MVATLEIIAAVLLIEINQGKSDILLTSFLSQFRYCAGLCGV